MESASVPMAVLMLGVLICDHSATLLSKSEEWSLTVCQCVVLGHSPTLISPRNEIMKTGVSSCFICHGFSVIHYGLYYEGNMERGFVDCSLV